MSIVPKPDEFISHQPVLEDGAAAASSKPFFFFCGCSAFFEGSFSLKAGVMEGAQNGSSFICETEADSELCALLKGATLGELRAANDPCQVTVHKILCTPHRSSEVDLTLMALVSGSVNGIWTPWARAALYHCLKASTTALW